MSKSYKISIVGAGNIGGTVASLLASRGSNYNIVLFDIAEGVAKGKTLDMLQMNAVNGVASSIVGTADFSLTENSDVVVVVAGIARKSGSGGREELLKANSDVISGVADNIKRYSPNAFVIVVTNPVDAMAYLFYKKSGFDSSKVVGMAGVLDTARLRYFYAQEFGVSVADVDGMVVGHHGNSMLPLKSCAKINGMSYGELLKKDSSASTKIENAHKRTRVGGGEIISLLGNGSAYYAPASSIVFMIDSYIFDQKKVLPASVLLQGQYGLKDIYAGVPVVIGSSGMEKIIELKLSEDEQKDFDASVGDIKNLIEALPDNV